MPFMIYSFLSVLWSSSNRISQFWDFAALLGPWTGWDLANTICKTHFNQGRSAEQLHLKQDRRSENHTVQLLESLGQTELLLLLKMILPCFLSSLGIYCHTSLQYNWVWDMNTEWISGKKLKPQNLVARRKATYAAQKHCLFRENSSFYSLTSTCKKTFKYFLALRTARENSYYVLGIYWCNMWISINYWQAWPHTHPVFTHWCW